MEGVVATEKHSEVCHPCLEFNILDKRTALNDQRVSYT